MATLPLYLLINFNKAMHIYTYVQKHKIDSFKQEQLKETITHLSNNTY